MIEAAVALAILGLLAALAMTALSGYSAGRQLAQGRVQLVSDLRTAADRARTMHRLVRVTLTAGSGGYVVETWTPPSGADPCDGSFLPAGQGAWAVSENDTLPQAVSVTGVPAVDPFVFSCLGTPYDPSTGATILGTQSPLVIVLSAHNATAVVTVNLGGLVQ